MRKDVIQSTWVVWSLSRRGPVHHCHNCGDRMWVRQPSGLCPLCWNGRREQRADLPVTYVTEGAALAGVWDDPAIERPRE